MFAVLPALSLIMLALSTLVIDLLTANVGATPEDFSHLLDPNAHLEDLVTCTSVPTLRLARA